MKKVLVTGATGFVGNAVTASLSENGYTPVALVRKGSENKLKTKTEIRHGDVLEPESLTSALEGIHAVIHLVGIIREYPSKGITFDRLHTKAAANMVNACVSSGVRRFVHMSANGTRHDAVSMYHKTKQEAEDLVKQSGLDYTIFRPSLIYGPDDSFINMLAGYMRKTPVFSYFGDGSYPMAPVFVEDVADCFVKSIDEKATTGMIYPLCGPENITYKELLKEVGRALGKNIILLPVPEFAISTGISLFGKTDWFPITRDQFIMLTEGNICSHDDAFRILNINRANFKEKIGSYL